MSCKKYIYKMCNMYVEEEAEQQENKYNKKKATKRKVVG